MNGIQQSRSHGLLVTLISIISLTSLTNGHGRMLHPLSRQSAWRYGENTPKEYNDHQMNCGGRDVQWNRNGGKCGICGDPFNGLRKYERPNGKNVQHNIIPTRNIYTQGEVIDVSIQVTANHKGWFEFRICNIAESEWPLTNVEATWGCLNKTLLPDLSSNAKTTQFGLPEGKRGKLDYRLVLPETLTCVHCVIQWKWHCGNSRDFGVEQEEFYACADVMILARNGQLPTTTTPPPTTTTATTTTTTTQKTTPPPTTTTTTKAPTQSPTQPYIPNTTKSTNNGDDDDDDDDNNIDDIFAFLRKQNNKWSQASHVSFLPKPKVPSSKENSSGNDYLCNFKCQRFGCQVDVTCYTKCPSICTEK